MTEHRVIDSLAPVTVVFMEKGTFGSAVVEPGVLLENVQYSHVRSWVDTQRAVILSPTGDRLVRIRAIGQEPRGGIRLSCGAVANGKEGTVPLYEALPLLAAGRAEPADESTDEMRAYALFARRQRAKLTGRAA